MATGHFLQHEGVVDQLQAIASFRGRRPEQFQVDNWSEFICKDLDKWAHENKVVLDFSHPGNPTDNPFIESFNGSLKDECLNSHWFMSLEDAREKIEGWRNEYNESQPHSSLVILTPVQFMNRHFEARNLRL